MFDFFGLSTQLLRLVLAQLGASSSSCVLVVHGQRCPIRHIGCRESIVVNYEREPATQDALVIQYSIHSAYDDLE
jgi:hypothetical protein